MKENLFKSSVQKSSWTCWNPLSTCSMSCGLGRPLKGGNPKVDGKWMRGWGGQNCSNMGGRQFYLPPSPNKRSFRLTLMLICVVTKSSHMSKPCCGEMDGKNSRENFRDTSNVTLLLAMPSTLLLLHFTTLALLWARHEIRIILAYKAVTVVKKGNSWCKQGYT